MLLCRRFNLFYLQEIWTEDRDCEQIMLFLNIWQCSFREAQTIGKMCIFTEGYKTVEEHLSGSLFTISSEWHLSPCALL